MLVLRRHGHVRDRLNRKVEPRAPADPAGTASGLSAEGLRIARLSADEVVAKRGVAEVRVRFEGAQRLVDRVTELADGTLDADALVGEFGTDDQPAVRRLVDGLQARGMLRQGTADDPVSAFWRSVSGHALGGRDRLRDSAVLLVGAGTDRPDSGPDAGPDAGPDDGPDDGPGDELVELLDDALGSCGVGHVDRVDAAPGPDAEPAAGLWCAGTVGPPQRLLAVADAALAARAVFLPVWLDDLVIHVGPMTHPYDTACLRCYLLRRESNDPEREVHRMLAGTDGGLGAGHLPAMPAIAAQLAAVEIVKQLAGLPVTTAGRTIELGLVPYRSRVHRVLRVPRCPSCSGVGRQSAPVVALGPQLSE